jgi:hypothetical protein
MKPGKDLLDGIINLAQCQQKEPNNLKSLSTVERRAIDTGLFPSGFRYYTSGRG